MNLDNIKEGMIIKNYPELCKILELEPQKGGNARKCQQDWIDDYISYVKDGHKYIIRDVYNDIEIIPMNTRGGDMSDNTHIEYIEKLILDILVQDKSEGELFLSKTKLFEALDMVNQNYGYCNARSIKLSKFIDVQEINAEEWFSSTTSMLERSLNKALKRLENQSLISWSKKVTVKIVEPVLRSAEVDRIVFQDSYDEQQESFAGKIKVREETREATVEELRHIITIERLVMDSMGFDGKQEVMKNRKWFEFEDEVKRIILRDINVAYYWKSYHVVFNPEHILTKSNKLNDKLLKSDERWELKDLLNKKMIDTTDNNSTGRNERAGRELAETYLGFTPVLNQKKIERLERRSDISYIEDSHKLSDTLIKKGRKDIRKEVKYTKLNSTK